MNTEWHFNDKFYDEMTVEVEFDGYHQDEVRYLRNGDPGYPAEGDDTRRIVALTLFGERMAGDTLAAFFRTNPGFEAAAQAWVGAQDLPDRDDWLEDDDDDR